MSGTTFALVSEVFPIQLAYAWNVYMAWGKKLRQKV